MKLQARWKLEPWISAELTRAGGSDSKVADLHEWPIDLSCWQEASSFHLAV